MSLFFLLLTKTTMQMDMATKVRRTEPRTRRPMLSNLVVLGSEPGEGPAVERSGEGWALDGTPRPDKWSSATRKQISSISESAEIKQLYLLVLVLVPS